MICCDFPALFGNHLPSQEPESGSSLLPKSKPRYCIGKVSLSHPTLVPVRHRLLAQLQVGVSLAVERWPEAAVNLASADAGRTSSALIGRYVSGR